LLDWSVGEISSSRGEPEAVLMATTLNLRFRMPA